MFVTIVLPSLYSPYLGPGWGVSESSVRRRSCARCRLLSLIPRGGCSSPPPPNTHTKESTAIVIWDQYELPSSTTGCQHPQPRYLSACFSVTMGKHHWVHQCLSVLWNVQGCDTVHRQDWSQGPSGILDTGQTIQGFPGSPNDG